MKPGRDPEHDIWNEGPGWEDALLDACGTNPDAHRMRHYRLLWDLGP